ncbi:hypothetical protein AN963_14290 [Brevibacillus choshinensis]|uniref:Uncharacterized protein n=1 Tax=Brevibacillus choshinensis TaxID=54911 RepID=A0ABR5N685_BRECH|nr:spore germination protein [Brevibacillus choshinensis]KQL46150.1 hypothetical protein AN963_14290 [Brevibacillus choshinensis]
MNWSQELSARLRDSSDYQSSQISIEDESFTLCFLESLIDSPYIQDHIIEKLHWPNNEMPFSALTSLDQAMNEILQGNLVIIKDSDQTAYIAIGKGMEHRSIQESENESSLRGPRDSFVESLHTNLSLIRRRYPDPELKVY